MRPLNELILSGGTAGTASFVSNSIWAANIVRASFQVVVSSGAFNGTIVVRGSNDQAVGVPPNQFTPTNWNIIGSSSQVVCSSTPTGLTFLIPMFETCYEYLQVRGTDGSTASAFGLVNVRLKADSL